MATLKEWHARSLQEKWAMPHFNFSNLEQFHALTEAAREAKAPLVVGLSEGERDAVGLAEAVALVAVARADGYPIFLNADHSRSPETARKAVDAGFDSVHIDLSKEPYEDNIAGTKEVVEYAKAKNPGIEVEGELGYLATESSKVYKEEVVIPEDSYTKPEQAVEYVAKTGVDRFASAIGNLHGIAANEPKLRFELVEELRRVLPANLTLVLHGGSGIAEGDFKKVIALGFNNAHVNTELRVAYTKALRAALAENPEETAPYKYVESAKEATKAVALENIRLFGAEGKAV